LSDRKDKRALKTAARTPLARSGMLPRVEPLELHAAVKQMYSWADICMRLETVYALALRTHSDGLLPRLARFYRCGEVAGKLFCCVVVVEHLYGCWLDWWRPRRDIDLAPKFKARDDACKDDVR
jgi:phosphatidylinositol glycan class A protein